MSSKKYCNDSHHRLKPAAKPPTLEIDLINFSPTSPQKPKSSYHTSIDLSDFINSTPSILRPINVEAMTPPISRNWASANNSIIDDGNRAKKSRNSINESNYYKSVVEKRNYDELITKLDKLLDDEEEEENFNLSEFSDEMDDKPLKHLNSLITKIRNKSFDIKCNPEKSVSFWETPKKPFSHKFENSFSDEIEDRPNINSNSLEMQCYRLNKYLEENEIYLPDSSESDFNHNNFDITCDMKMNRKQEEIERNYKSNKVLSKQNNSKYSPIKKSEIKTVDQSSKNSPETSNSKWLTSPIQRKKIVSSAHGLLYKNVVRGEQKKNRKNVLISCQLDSDF